MKRPLSFVLVFALLLSGCVTDELLVFEDNVLTEAEMGRFVGTFQGVREGDDPDSDEFADSQGRTKFRIRKEGREYHFSYNEPLNGSIRSETFSGSFRLSRVPGSKTNLLVFSCPEVVSTNPKSRPLKNFFAVLKRQDDTLQVWLMTPNQLVLDDHPLNRTPFVRRGFYKAEEVRAFLAEHADAYAAANSPSLLRKVD